jgi:chromosome partitioning protein
MPQAKVVSFVNYKGGVGKTTLAVEISASLAHHYNKKVLLIDADPQTNATFCLMDEDEWDEHYRDKTLKEIFEAEMRNEIIDINQLIIKEGLKIHSYTRNLHLIPSHIELYDIDIRLASIIGAGATRARTILKRYINNIKENYDYIIIDCPPNMYLVTQNAIVASDSIIITCLPEYLSTRGIALIDRVVTDVINQINRDLAIGGGSINKPEIKGIIFNRVRHGPTGILKDQQRNINNVRNLPYLGNKVFEN